MSFGMSLVWQIDINQDNRYKHAIAGLIIKLKETI